MTMEYMANLGSMIGGLAIFVSLLYLAVETRVNTKAIRSAAYHSSAVSIADNVVTIFSNRDSASLMTKSLSLDSIEDLSADDQMRFASFVGQVFIRYEDIFAQYRQGAVPPELWEVRRKFARSVLELPAWKTVWDLCKNSPIFIPAFIEEVETAELVPNPYMGVGGMESASSAE